MVSAKKRASDKSAAKKPEKKQDAAEESATEVAVPAPFGLRWWQWRFIKWAITLGVLVIFRAYQFI